MAVKLNRRGETYAQARINRGKIDYDGEWSFSDDERNALFADGIERFADWHLGRDLDGDDDRASSYLFATGKDGKVYRSALDAAIRESRRLKKKDPGAADIEASAKELLERIDRKKANSRRLLFFGEKPGLETETDPRKRFEGVILMDTSIVLGDHPDMVEGGGREGWTQIALTGKFLGHWQGPFELTEDDLAVMVENKNRFVNPILFDYGHESVWNSAALASGWGHEFEIGKKGQALYSNTEWTDEASSRIRAGELKYISPVIMFSTIDPYTGDDLGPSIWTVGLLNTPFLDGMDPVEIGGQIAASRQANDGAPPRRTWAIPQQNTPPADAGTLNNNKPPEPEPAEPAPEPEVTVNSTQTQKEDIVERKKLCQELGISEDSTDEQIFATIKAKGAPSPDDTQALSDAQAAQAAAEEAARVAQEKSEGLEAEKKERELKDAQELTEAYIKANRIAPASRERACKLALEDRESFYSLYGRPDEPGDPVAPTAAVATAEPATAGPGAALTDEDQEAIAKMRPRLERLARKRSARLSKAQGKPVTVTVEEMFTEEKTRRQDAGVLGKVFKHPPTKNTTRID